LQGQAKKYIAAPKYESSRGTPVVGGEERGAVPPEETRANAQHLKREEMLIDTYSVWWELDGPRRIEFCS